jgi:hypothetical protein
MTPSSWIIMGVTVVAFAACFVLALRYGARRARRLAAFAREGGYPFSSDDREGLGAKLDASLPDYRYRLTNVITISVPGARVFAADCEYWLPRGRVRPSFDQCLVVERERPFLQRWSVSPHDQKAAQRVTAPALQAILAREKAWLELSIGGNYALILGPRSDAPEQTKAFIELGRSIADALGPLD